MGQLTLLGHDGRGEGADGEGGEEGTGLHELEQVSALVSLSFVLPRASERVHAEGSGSR